MHPPVPELCAAFAAAGFFAYCHMNRGDVKVGPPAEMERWTKATAEIDDQWVKDVSAKGANGAALLDEARALLKQYDK